jgi:hypothetical protein
MVPESPTAQPSLAETIATEERDFKQVGPMLESHCQLPAAREAMAARPAGAGAAKTGAIESDSNSEKVTRKVKHL